MSEVVKEQKEQQKQQQQNNSDTKNDTNTNEVPEQQQQLQVQQQKEDNTTKKKKFHFSIDRGGTFTDIYCHIEPYGIEIVRKLLSDDPSNYNDAPTEGIRQILQEYDTDTTSNNTNNNIKYQRGIPINTTSIGSIRMGTTVATNALLERNGSNVGYIVTKGFADLLLIGNQNRINIFDLSCNRPSVLYTSVLEINERIILSQYYNNDSKESSLQIETGITGEGVYVLQKPNVNIIRKQLLELYKQGITSIAISLLHSYIYPYHEQIIANIATELNVFEHISCSHIIMPMIKLVSRSHTTNASAYLTPKITLYISNFINGFDTNLLTSNIPIQFMKSDGGLTSITNFGGHQAILSGPAGGVIGYAKTTKLSTTSNNANAANNSDSTNNKSQQLTAVIGFDMGGTSTDVSRYEMISSNSNNDDNDNDAAKTSSSSNGGVEIVMETITAGIIIQAPQLNINTVAAGGGSVLKLHRGMFLVGPESVRAYPGPICYKKGGTILSVTDANVILGRIVPDYFPKIFGPNENEQLDIMASKIAFEQMLCMPEANNRTCIEELAYGFLVVANETMCRPIRNLTQMKGYNIQQHILSCFGGAGPQHACAIAKTLGITKVFIHKYGGILSAYGLSMADIIHNEQCPACEIFSTTGSTTTISTFGQEQFNLLINEAKTILLNQGYAEELIIIEKYLNMRYDGTDNSIMIKENSYTTYDETFRSTYMREYGFTLHDRSIIIDDYRIQAIIPGTIPKCTTSSTSTGCASPILVDVPPEPIPENINHRAYFESGWYNNVPVYKIENLVSNQRLIGPCLIIQPISTVVIEENCIAHISCDGNIEIDINVNNNNKTNTPIDNDTTNNAKEENDNSVTTDVEEDPVQLSIYAHRFMGIAEQMGKTLQRTAISVNMKERLDFSCAIFTKDGGLVANAPHIPVHLGAMERAVKFQVEYWHINGDIQPGDVLVSNHPQLAGGSHLPDITVITPVFHNNSKNTNNIEIIFFVASRGHHADIGGIAPGSMPPHSTQLQDEGAMIVAFKLVKEGIFQEDGITKLLQSPSLLIGNYGTRNLRDNLSDLRAQVAANNAGIRLLTELVTERGLYHVNAYMYYIQKNAEQAVRKMLIEFVNKQNNKTIHHAIDYMDDGSRIELKITIDIHTGSAIFDFTGTGPQVLGNHNAPPAVTYSAVIYSLRSLVADDIPLNQGCLAPITFIIPKNCLLNPSSDAAVVGGNVLTSQRVVDVVLKAFSACAASQGCMNNLSFGDNTFGYYETIAGGAGAGPTWDGTSGIHTHCTNTRITDPEILEKRYPVLLHQFSIRPNSGGIGLHPGGDGVIREIEPLKQLTMSILSERRVTHPYGMAGGSDGQCGQNTIIRRINNNNSDTNSDSSSSGVESSDTNNNSSTLVINVGGRCTTKLNVGDRLRIETPGGGGYGTPVVSEQSQEQT